MRYTLVALLLLVPLKNASATRRPFFVAGDVYDSGAWDQEYRSGHDIEAAINATPDKASSTSTSSRPGAGVRVGCYAINDAKWELAASFGFVVSPRTTTTVKNVDLDPASKLKISEGTTEIVTDATFIRPMVELGRRWDFKRFAFKLGGGVGLAFGTIKREQRVTGTAAAVAQAYSTEDFCTAGTFEISPSVIVPFGEQELELGVRYAQLSARGPDARIPDFDWRPISVFAAYRFGPANF